MTRSSRRLLESWNELNDPSEISEGTIADKVLLSQSRRQKEDRIGFDRGNCNHQGLIVPKSKREGRQDRRKPAVPRTNIIRSG
jgi:hypothetical protein